MAACGPLEQIREQATRLAGTPAPQRPDVPGGESESTYAEAVATWESAADTYAAGEDFVAEVNTALDQLDDICSYTTGLNEIHQAMEEDFNDYNALRTIEPGEFQEFKAILGYDGHVRNHTLECHTQMKCYPADEETRQKVGDQWDASMTLMHEGLAELLRDNCPAASLSAYCSHQIELEEELAELSVIHAEAIRTDDPIEAMKRLDEAAYLVVNEAWLTYANTWIEEDKESLRLLDEAVPGAEYSYDALEILIINAADSITAATSQVTG